MSKVPKTYGQFAETFPALADAWERSRVAEGRGPLDDRARRLAKLAIAIGALREGAVRSATRKALDAGVTREEILQVIALSATTIGFPSAVAVFSWVQELTAKKRRR